MKTSKTQSRTGSMLLNLASRIMLVTVLVVGGLSIQSARAADITWDINANAGIQGGDGNWDTTDTNWTTDGGMTRSVWDNANWWDDIALFSASFGRVTVGENINLAGINVTTTSSGTVGGRSAVSYLLQGTGSLNFGSQQGVIAHGAAGVVQIDNAMHGTGGLAINGSSTDSGKRVILIGNNQNLTGGITVNDGVLGFDNPAALGNNQITLNAGKLIGPVDYSGTGTTSIAGTSGRVLSNAIHMTAGTTSRLEVWGGRTWTHSGSLTGSGDFNIVGAGTITLAGDASGFTGPYVRVVGGGEAGNTTLRLGVDDAMGTKAALYLGYDGTGSFDMNGHSQTLTSIVRRWPTDYSRGAEVYNSGSEQSVLTINPAGDESYVRGRIVPTAGENDNIRLVVKGNKTAPTASAPRFARSLGGGSAYSDHYTGGTEVDGGTFLVGADGLLGAVPATFDADNITLRNHGTLGNHEGDLTLNANHGITLASGGGGLLAGWNATTTVGGVISGGVNDKLTILDNSGTVVLSAHNTYAGGTDFSGITVAVGNDAALGTGDVDWGSSTIRSANAEDRALANSINYGASMTFGSSDTGNLLFTGDVITGGFSKTFTVENDITEFSGVITGSGPRIKNGPGKLILSAVNNDTGTMSVDVGVLEITSTGSLVSSSVSVDSGAPGRCGSLRVSRPVRIPALGKKPVSRDFMHASPIPARGGRACGIFFEKHRPLQIVGMEWFGRSLPRFTGKPEILFLPPP